MKSIIPELFSIQLNIDNTMMGFSRKYVSIVVLILMGLFLLDLTNTDKEDLYVMEQTEIQSSMSFDGNEFDDEEDSDSTDIAPDIVNFVNTHFPETSILSCNQTEHYYRVILSDNTKVYSPAQNAERVADHFINVCKSIRSFA